MFRRFHPPQHGVRVQVLQTGDLLQFGAELDGSAELLYLLFQLGLLGGGGMAESRLPLQH